MGRDEILRSAQDDRLRADPGALPNRELQSGAGARRRRTVRSACAGHRGPKQRVPLQSGAGAKRRRTVRRACAEHRGRQQRVPLQSGAGAKRRRTVKSGGESGIRTRERLAPLHDFQSCPFGHSGTSPRGRPARRAQPMGRRWAAGPAAWPWRWRSGGESGIRTHGRSCPLQRFSRPPPSSAPPSLRTHRLYVPARPAAKPQPGFVALARRFGALTRLHTLSYHRKRGANRVGLLSGGTDGRRQTSAFRSGPPPFRSRRGQTNNEWNRGQRS